MAGARVGRHAGSGHASGCDGAGAGARADQWARAGGRGGTGAGQGVGRVDGREGNKQASERKPAGAEARASASESAGRTSIRRIYEKVEANSKLERIGLIDRYRRYRQAKVAWHRNTAVSAPMHRQGIPPDTGTRPFPRCCRRIQPGVRAKKAKSLRNNSTRDCAPLFFHVGRLHHPR